MISPPSSPTRSIKQALIGTGASNTPTGVVFAGAEQLSFSGAPTWAKVLEFPASVQAADADLGSMAFVSTPAAVAKLRATTKVANDGSAGFLMDSPTQLAGFPLVTTTALPATGQDSPSTEQYVVFGAWSQLLVGYWSGVDLLANPYEGTAYAKGRALVRVMRDVDVAVRHPESFAFSDDLEVA